MRAIELIDASSIKIVVPGVRPKGLRRVEMWRGCLGLHSGCWLFRLPVPQYQTMLRFHIPLIELDVPN